MLPLNKIVVMAACVSVLASASSALLPETTLKQQRVVGIGFDAPRERENFAAFQRHASELLSSNADRVSFEFVPVNLSDDLDVARKIPQIVHEQPTMIVAGNWGLARAVQRVSQHVPVVFLSMAEPTDVGIVEREGWPRTNATGVTLAAPIVAAQLDWLLAAAPKARRLIIITDKWWDENRARTDLLEHLAHRQEISAEFRSVNSLEDAQAIIRDFDASAFDAWFFPAGFAVFIAEKEWINFVKERHIVAAFNSENWGDQAGVVTYQEDRTDFQQRVGEYIYAVLGGRPVGEMAIFRPSRFRLTANIRQARAVDLQLPAEVLLSADRVIR